jgi:beta-fructofuranosidase
MGFALPDHWVWDFWLADDGQTYHMFYLHAPKSLGNPDLRHRNARIGHATSTDLRDWQNHGQILDAGPAGSFDGSATWTGSVTRGSDGRWRLFYTGSRFLSPDSNANIETIGCAVSDDLYSWEKLPGPILEADDAWYERLGMSAWPEEAWRDPWVFRHDGRWQMLITARANHGEVMERGVVGHAVSDDMTTWQVRPPLSKIGAGFAHLEVPQIVDVLGQTFLIWCCDGPKLSGHLAGRTGGIWAVSTLNPLGPYDIEKANLVTSEELYAGRVAFDRNDTAVLLAFRNRSEGGDFGGSVSDPIPLTVRSDAEGRPQLVEVTQP